jgi:cell division protein FtsB
MNPLYFHLAPPEKLDKQHKTIKDVILPYIFGGVMKLRLQIPQSWPLYLLATLILLLAAYTIVGERGVFHLWRLRGEKARLDEQTFVLQKENESLRQKVSRLRHDNFYLEEIAREELNLVRPGEVIYRFPSSEARNTRQRALRDPASESRPSAAQKARR